MLGYLRGNRVVWDGAAGLWRYPDTGEPAEGNPRPCPRCSGMPTPAGHDPCIAGIPGAAGACCGHGVHRGYVNWPGIDCGPGWWQRAYVGDLASTNNEI